MPRTWQNRCFSNARPFPVLDPTQPTREHVPSEGGKTMAALVNWVRSCTGGLFTLFCWLAGSVASLGVMACWGWQLLGWRCLEPDHIGFVYSTR